MESTRVYIPLTLASFILLSFGFYSIFNSGSDEATFDAVPSLEFEEVIHDGTNIALSDSQFEELETYFPASSHFNYSMPQYILLFLSGSDPCSNCFNEILDYLTLANNHELISDHYLSILLFHGSNETESTRFIRSSNMLEHVHTSTFIKSNEISRFDYGNFSDLYRAQNMLYLIDRERQVVFHSFLLPAGTTTRFDQKEIAFKNAIQTHIN